MFFSTICKRLIFHDFFFPFLLTWNPVGAKIQNATPPTVLALICVTTQQSYCRHAGFCRPSVKSVFSDPVKQINAKFGGKVPFFTHFSRFL